MELSNDQSNALDYILSWYNGQSVSVPYITIGGYAGTGKTHLLSALRHYLQRNTTISYCTYTGKASTVLYEKLLKHNSLTNLTDDISTIHRLIYEPQFEWDPVSQHHVLTGFNKKTNIWADLIVIDEASMVSESIWNDLVSYGVPILAIGDHGQLPPIQTKKDKEEGKLGFNLMNNPNVVLNKIHRQASNSPIIQLSYMARTYQPIPNGQYGSGVIKTNWSSSAKKYFNNSIDFSDKDLITLCGLNKNRVLINKQIRDRLGFKMKEPGPSERLICLKNNHDTGVMNGQLGSLVLLFHETPRIYRLTLEMDSGDYYTTCVPKYSFGEEYQSEIMSRFYSDKSIEKLRKNNEITDLFDYGFSISVHKSQGSEWNKVVLFDDWGKWDQEFYAKWLYTGITRAKEKLFLVGDFDGSF